MVAINQQLLRCGLLICATRIHTVFKFRIDGPTVDKLSTNVLQLFCQNLNWFGDGVQTKDDRETGRAVSIKRSRKQSKNASVTSSLGELKKVTRV